jgi:ariadne-1
MFGGIFGKKKTPIATQSQVDKSVQRLPDEKKVIDAIILPVVEGIVAEISPRIGSTLTEDEVFEDNMILTGDLITPISSTTQGEYEVEDFEENGDDTTYGFKDIVKKEDDFQSMDIGKLIEQQQAEVIELSATLDVPVGVGGALLRAYRWKKEKLLLDFFEDQAKVCKVAGIDLSTLGGNLVVGKKDMECSACLDDHLGKDMRSLTCNHFMCTSCWKEYIEVAIDGGPTCLSLVCPAHNCKLIVDESIVVNTVDTNHATKYRNFLSRSFVDDNPNVKWCPAPNCGKVVFCPNSSVYSVKCQCGHGFCPKCQLESHQPCLCEQVKLWGKKCEDDSETANYIVVNTRECPKCHRSIEKNGGCNHMTCSLCRYEFCWICMGDWKQHGSESGGYYACNKFKGGDKQDEKNQSDARHALERYMHYYTRFANHQQSQKFEGKLRRKAETMMTELQNKNKYSSWLDVQFIEKAVDQLVDCRAALKYTYTYAYFLVEGPQKVLFEYLQEELEKNTEALSEILEGTKVYEREKVITLTKIASTRLSHLLEGVGNGLHE